jgi:hypothetical protein
MQHQSRDCALLGMGELLSLVGAHAIGHSAPQIAGTASLSPHFRVPAMHSRSLQQHVDVWHPHIHVHCTVNAHTPWGGINSQVVDLPPTGCVARGGCAVCGRSLCSGRGHNPEFWCLRLSPHPHLKAVPLAQLAWCKANGLYAQIP